MKITAVRQLKNGRYGLFSDGQLIQTADEQSLADSGIREGDDLDEQTLARLASADETRRAEEKAYDLLTFRDHSGGELRGKLRRSVGEEAAQAAVEKMEQLGLVDDEAFALKYARELLFLKLLGDRRAVFELTRRGVDKAFAEETVASFGDDPAARALKWLQKKYPRGLSGPDDRRKASAALSRAGYAWDEIRDAMSKYGMDEEDAD